MKVAPFGQYQPDKRKGISCVHASLGCAPNQYAVWLVSVGPTVTKLSKQYATLAIGGVAAYQLARRCNAVSVPSNSGEWP